MSSSAADLEQERPILYNYWWSSCAWRVRSALNLKGIDYVYRAVDMDADEHHSAWYLAAVNPRGLVPALAVPPQGGRVLTESLAIMEYLEERYPEKEPHLLPSIKIFSIKCIFLVQFSLENADDRAAVRALALQIACNIQPLQNTGVMAYFKRRHNGDLSEADLFARHWIEVGFGALEMTLQKTAGKFAYADQISIADICIPPQVYNATE